MSLVALIVGSAALVLALYCFVRLRGVLSDSPAGGATGDITPGLVTERLLCGCTMRETDDGDWLVLHPKEVDGEPWTHRASTREGAHSYHERRCLIT